MFQIKRGIDTEMSHLPKYGHVMTHRTYHKYTQSSIFIASSREI